MLELILGFGLRLVPELFGFIGKYFDNKHEVTMQKLSMDAMRITINGKIEMSEMELAAKDASETRDAINVERDKLNQPVAKSGNKKIDAYNASLRTTVAYMVISAYISQKIIGFYLLLKYYSFQLPVFILKDLQPILWTAFDRQVMLIIIGYCFGVQAIKAIKGK